MRGAALLRHQLIENTVIAHEHEHHDHAIYWKSQDIIQREKARIQDDIRHTSSTDLISSASSTPTRHRTSSFPKQSLPCSSTRSSSRESPLTGLPLSPNQSARDKLPAVVSDDDNFDDVWSRLRPVPVREQKVDPDVLDLSARYDSAENLCGERYLSCVSFASRADASKWADSGRLGHLSAIHFRPRGAGHTKTTVLTLKCASSLPVSQNGKDARASVLIRDQQSKSAHRVNHAARKDHEDVTLLSFFEDDHDDDSGIGLSADNDESIRQPFNRSAAPNQSKHLKFLGKYSESLSCIIPKFSSATPATSSSTAQSRAQHQRSPSFEEYKAHFSDDDDEIEITFSARSDQSKTLCGYSFLLQDPAYLHAQQAGLLWQSLVGQHVRFPRHWWNGLRGPPMTIGSKEEQLPPWYHLGSCSIRNHQALKRIVRNRASPGRLLLHVLVRDGLSGDIVCDLAVGCYHPNARGIRKTQKPDLSLENTRQVWMAFRNRTRWSVPVIDQWINSEVECRSPIGKNPITNDNILVVYGGKSPLETMLLSEGDLSEVISKAHKSCPPALVLCESYVFN